MKPRAEHKGQDLGKLFRRLSGIYRIPKCSQCSCLLDTIKELQEASRGTSWEEKAADLAARIHVTHGCLGCSPCYPVAISNALYEMAGAGEDTCPACEGAPCEEPAEPSVSTWPVVVGEYLLGSPAAPVAVTTLGSTELPDLIIKAAPETSLAIVGKTETENIGIEKIVLNLVSNPHIRFLVLCGGDAQGHFPGQTLLALLRNGMDEGHRVLGTPAHRPVLRNVTEAQVERLTAQITPVDLIGCTDTSAIVREIERCVSENPGSLAEAAAVEKVAHIRAQPARKLSLDKVGFFIVYVDRARDIIILEHYQMGGKLNLVLEGNDAASLYSTAIEHGLVGQLDHAAYLGKELARAELSLKLGFKYVQDRAPGE
ncbi:MAG: DUF4346 domain-containing protein [Chloroflexi bacterium]|nr:DUF4346 domain-containing protein [Chloroflexota bacterium]